MNNYDMDRAQPALGVHPDEFDRLLVAHFAQDQEIAPSSGFALSVMEAVYTETSGPPPLSFPWARVLPGAIALLCAMTGFALVALRNLRVTAATAPQTPRGLAIRLHQQLWGLHLAPVEQTVCWAAMAACLSFVVATGSMRMAGSGR